MPRSPDTTNIQTTFLRTFSANPTVPPAPTSNHRRLNAPADSPTAPAGR
jgi:hypothetical protein